MLGVSATTIPAEQERFDPEDEAILAMLPAVQMYAAVQTERAVLFLAGGMLDNARGMAWSEAELSRDDLHPLFHVVLFEPVAPNLYYFVAN